MNRRTKWFGFLVAIAAVCYLLTADLFVERRLSKSGDGQEIVTLGPGIYRSLARLWNFNAADDRNETIRHLQFLDKDGKVLARFAPLSVCDWAKVVWTSQLVAVAIGQNGEGANTYIFDRHTGQPQVIDDRQSNLLKQLESASYTSQ